MGRKRKYRVQELKYPEYIIELREQSMTGDMKFLVNLLVSEGKGWYMAVGKWNGKSKKEAIKQAELQANRWDCEIEYKFLPKIENQATFYTDKVMKRG